MTVSFDFNFWAVLMFAANFIWMASMSISNRGKVAADELKAMQKSLSGENKVLEEKVMKRLGQHSERISTLEAKVEDAINGDDLTALRRHFDDQVNAVHRRVDEVLKMSSHIGGQLDGAQRSLDTLTTNINALMQRRASDHQ